MFYLNFENQLQLLVLLLFSSYIFFTALSIKLGDVCLKSFGLSFFIPLSLSCFSFFIAPYNIKLASLSVDLSWFLLLIMLTLVSLINRSSESAKFLYPITFILPFSAIALQEPILDLQYLFYIRSVIIAIITIQLIMIVFCILSRNKIRLYMHLGIFMVSIGYLLFSLVENSLLYAFLASVTGFFLCALYFYKNTYGILKVEYSKSGEALKRINQNVHLEVVRRVEEIEKTNRKLVEISKTDSMTGLYVKSAILKNLETRIERAPNVQFSLLMIDIDRFKVINDTQGHQIGDKCIKTLATLAETSFRKDDILGRYGGDEFIVILPNALPVRAYLVADRFRQMIQNKTNPNITVSVGIATFPQDEKTAASLIAAADKALYSSKQSGRNRVTNFSSIPQILK